MNQIMDLQNAATFLSKPSSSSSAAAPLGFPVKTSLLFSDSSCLLGKKKNKRITTTTAAEAVPNSNYVVPLDKSSASSCITRPLAEILRDLNKKVPDKIIKPDSNCIIPWFHANRMLSFYAPGKLFVLLLLNITYLPCPPTYLPNYPVYRILIYYISSFSFYCIAFCLNKCVVFSPMIVSVVHIWIGFW
ncbi:hypothetical protein MKW94_030113 [Papaver nudicaule]|uniref:Uncharacterized protein n=1 Tax=Papaver nudicaule TaxID=74823 RepID=A0AA41RR10_PAPNU|nr:hypothetical protein [Papaver nudicaule]